jgi:hypothetical protein
VHTQEVLGQHRDIVKKSKEGRQKKTKKHFGTARVLTVEEALRMK